MATLLYKLNIKLIHNTLGKDTYEHKTSILTPAVSVLEANSRFLESINKSQLFTIDGITWPVEYTRVLVTHTEVVSKVVSAPNEQTSSEVVTIVTKKERKKRSPNKPKAAVVGIKPNGRGRKSSK